MKALSSLCHFLHDLACVLFWAILCVRAGGKPGRARRGGDGGDRRREGGAGVAVQGEAADAAVRQEDPVRGAQAQRREAAADEGPVRQAPLRRRRPVRRHLDVRSRTARRAAPCVRVRCRDLPAFDRMPHGLDWHKSSRKICRSCTIQVV